MWPISLVFWAAEALKIGTFRRLLIDPQNSIVACRDWPSKPLCTYMSRECPHLDSQSRKRTIRNDPCSKNTPFRRRDWWREFSSNRKYWISMGLYALVNEALLSLTTWDRALDPQKDRCGWHLSNHYFNSTHPCRPASRKASRTGLELRAEDMKMPLAKHLWAFWNTLRNGKLNLSKRWGLQIWCLTWITPRWC